MSRQVIMIDPFEDPFGTTSSRPRLSESETVERMLEAGSRLVQQSGLQISFDPLRLEDVIAEADVSRSAVYKRWPRKEQYYAELLLRLAGDTQPAAAAFDGGTSGTPQEVLRIATDHSSWFGTADGRHRLLVEMCRLGAQQNYDALVARPDWAIYVTLHAALKTLPDNAFKETLRRTLARSEANFVQKMSTFYEAMLALLGYRLKVETTDMTVQNFAMMGAAAVEGVLLMSGANDDLTHHRFLMDPFGVGKPSDWSYVSYLFTAMAVNAVEPDPFRVWDEDEVEAVHSVIAEIESSLRGMFE